MIGTHAAEETTKTMNISYPRDRRSRGRVARPALAAVLSLIALMIGAPSAQAAFGLESAGIELIDANGERASQAGGHPDFVAEFKLNTLLLDGAPAIDGSNLKDMLVDLPPGLIGNPQALPACAPDMIVAGLNMALCPPETQVGTVAIEWNQGGETWYESGKPVYNVEAPYGQPARLAFNLLEVVTNVFPRVRTGGDYGVSADSRDTSQSLAVYRAKVTIWGVPADPSHDRERAIPGVGRPPLPSEDPVPSVAPRRAFLSASTSCSGVASVFGFSASSWAEPGVFVSRLVSEDVGGVPLVNDGCDRLGFTPSIEVRPTSVVAGSPTGLDVEVVSPQNMDSPDGLVSAHLRDARVLLPEGMSVNPASADGLVGCSDAQVGMDSAGPAGCPAGSKIGSVEVDTPVIADPLPGSVYVGSQNSDDPLSGDMFRLFLVVESKERGVRVKLEGKIRVNPQTGRLETTFADNPQLPVERVRLSLKSGPRAPLAMPASCGEKTVEADLSSWAGHDVEVSDSFTIPCPAGDRFAPVFDAGSVLAMGGSFSPFTAQIDRSDSDQFLSGIRAELPEGLLARLKGVAECPDAVADDDSPGLCGAGSRIGTATVGAGAGSSPLFIEGDLHLTGPYKGAPYGLVAQVHAKAGPYDLGWVKVRNALHVDPVTAQVTVISDALPQIVKGVPVRLRSIDVDVDRPGFTVNPTSCASKRVDATLTSTAATAHRAGVGFAAANCQALAFKPRVSLALTGRKQIRTGKHPGVKGIVRQTGLGEAAIDHAKVTLPGSLALDPDNAQALCEHDQGTRPDLEDHCPTGSIIGKVKATTPLLQAPLQGNVYFVKNVERNPKTGALIRKLPMLVAALRGDIAINITGKSSTTKDGRLVTTFPTVPDAPINRFDININGGTNGILTVTRTRKAKINLCTKPNSHRANVALDGHNNKTVDYPTKVKTPCTPTQTKKPKNTKKN